MEEDNKRIQNELDDIKLENRKLKDQIERMEIRNRKELNQLDKNCLNWKINYYGNSNNQKIK